jgi:hypothetical protein
MSLYSGLSQCLPKGYPSQHGIIEIRSDGHHSGNKKAGRKRRTAKKVTGWYYRAYQEC